MKQKIAVLTGAGVSAESGLKTFRDADGLWEGHDVMSVATPEAWERDPELVNKFYNARRRQLAEVKPNLAHQIIQQLEDHYEVIIITQNVDDLHERAGSSHIVHLHGELRKVRSIINPAEAIEWTRDLSADDLDKDGIPLRPAIVWFGEAVPMMDQAIVKIVDADILIIIGTSLQVYPAAGLMRYAERATKVYYIDPKPASNQELSYHGDRVISIVEKATVGMQIVYDQLVNRP